MSEEVNQAIVSSATRRLLQTQSPPETVVRFCYPTGACELSDLHDGVGGVVFQGEITGDQSGFSVSSAGDINGDGVDDLVVGALYADPVGRLEAGKSYVVFGSTQTNVWGSGTLNLNSLIDGQRGFVLQGEAASDQSGRSVSSAGDINGDGLDDLLIGASTASPPGRTQAGKSYVVFGSNQTNVWGNGTLELSSLIDGQRGFVLQGEAASDGSGSSVSSAGDINGDGLDDLLIGASRASPANRTNAGKSYIVFGSNQTNVWGSGTLELSSLIDGQRGFVLQGEAASDQSGWSVSGAGDINGDGLEDLLIGAVGANPAGRIAAGKSYVVFGSNQTNAWGSGTLELSSLTDGQRGFVLQGEAAGDNSGSSVSGAGDINGDGLDDLLIGAYFADPAGRTSAGKSYVIFGSNQTNAWGSGTLDLGSSIDGQRGFVLQGEAANDRSGSSVSGAGDINGDGLEDLLIGSFYAAPAARSLAGKSYVVFGSTQTNAWGNGTLDLSSLVDGQHGFVLQGEAAGDDSGHSVSGVGDINGDGVEDLLIGASGASPFPRTIAGKSYVIWGAATIKFTANHLRLAADETIPLDASMLAISGGKSPSTFTVELIQHGSFTAINAPNTALSQFYPQNISAGQIQFVHDGGSVEPSYRIYTVKSQLAYIYSDAEIEFLGFLPTLENNQLLVDQGLPTIITSSDLSASDRDDVSTGLQFIISNITHGYWNLLDSNGQILLNHVGNFSQQAIFENRVQFIHDGTVFPPSYFVAVSDGKNTIASRAALIRFNHAPELILQPMTLDQGTVTGLTREEISATDTETLAESLTLEVSNVSHGHFIYAGSRDFALHVFPQLPLITGDIQFLQDGSNSTPSFSLRAFDGHIYTPWQSAAVTLNHRPLRQIELSDHTVKEDETFKFTLPEDLFLDLDGDALNLSAQLKGGAPLPKGVTFDAQKHEFSGQLSMASVLQVEVEARDPRGLMASADFTLQSQSPASSSGIDLQTLYNTLSALGGAVVTIGGYLWWRSRVASHRQGFQFADYLRNVLNLEYHDFMRFQGDVYKTKIETFLVQLNAKNNFYNKLTEAQQKSFAVCVAEILQQRNLVSQSDRASGIYGWFFAFSVGWSNQLNLRQFERDISEIVKEAINAWQVELQRDSGDPLTKWVYHVPTLKEKARACCHPGSTRSGFFGQNMARSDDEVNSKETKESPIPKKKQEDDGVELLETGNLALGK